MFTRSTHKLPPTDESQSICGSGSVVRRRGVLGFTSIELLVSMTISLLGIALASGLMLAGKGHILQQEKELEATHAGRAAVETILRELRLGGACLPETGEFIALDAVENGTTDILTTRYGLTMPADMSCIQTATSQSTPGGSSVLTVDDVTGFKVGGLVYLRHTNGSGEYFKIVAVDNGANTISSDGGLSATYPQTSGVYAIDERRFFIDTTAGTPTLMFQVDDRPATPFALGIETLDIEYEFSDGTSTDAPANDQEWRSIRQIHVALTARSAKSYDGGQHYRRSFNVTIKPRNLVDS